MIKVKVEVEVEVELAEWQASTPERICELLTTQASTRFGAEDVRAYLTAVAAMAPAGVVVPWLAIDDVTGVALTVRSVAEQVEAAALAH